MISLEIPITFHSFRFNIGQIILFITIIALMYILVNLNTHSALFYNTRFIVVSNYQYPSLIRCLCYFVWLRQHGPCLCLSLINNVLFY